MKIELEGLSKHIPSTGNFITIDKSKCNGCNQCAIICIVNLWKVKGGVASIINDYKIKCLECGSCAQVCEPGAINFTYPAGGTGIVYEHG
jgi:ferredoxin-like protein FixX